MQTQYSKHSIAKGNPLGRYLATTAILLVLPITACSTTDPATGEFVYRVVTESDERKKNNREAARKREKERLARKKARRETTEAVVLGALDELYGSCFVEPENETEALARLEAVILNNSKRDYGTGGAC